MVIIIGFKSSMATPAFPQFGGFLLVRPLFGSLELHPSLSKESDFHLYQTNAGCHASFVASLSAKIRIIIFRASKQALEEIHPIAESLLERLGGLDQC